MEPSHTVSSTNTAATDAAETIKQEIIIQSNTELMGHMSPTSVAELVTPTCSTSKPPVATPESSSKPDH